MSATQVQAVAKPEKYLIRNNTAGYVGVITIDHKGEELGENIEPYGARWMTEEEMIATARAPRDPADNPFAEQVLVGVNPESQAREEFRLRPLTLEKDAARFVPSNERYVPTVDAPEDSAPPSSHESATALSPVAAPPSTGSDAGSPPPPEAPAFPQGGPVPPRRTQPTGAPRTEPQTALSGSQMPAGGGEEHQSWTEPPAHPGEVIDGTLGGSNDGPPEDAATAAPDPATSGERYTPIAGQANAAVQTPGAISDEQAAKVDPEVGEETGTAKRPTQTQPEGEYARAEEVGSPDAPAQDNDETLIGG